MSELHTLKTEHDLPYYSFYHNNVELVIWFSSVADSPNKIDQVNLSRVVPSSGGGYRPSNTKLTASLGYDDYVDVRGGVIGVINEIFLPRVNEYLASQGGGDNTFPEDKENFDIWMWSVNEGFSYVDGKVILKIQT